MPTQLPPEELRSFLAAIADEPVDPDLRLVFADWLDDQGDPRAGLIRWQVRRCRSRGADRRDRDVSSFHPLLWEWCDRHQRALGLEGLGVAAWYWGRPCMRLEGAAPPAGLPALLEAGWVEGLSGPAALVAGLGGLLWAVNDLSVEGGPDADLGAALKAAGTAAALRSLSLAGDLGVTDRCLRPVAALKRLAELRLPAGVTDAARAELRRALPGCRIDAAAPAPQD